MKFISAIGDITHDAPGNRTSSTQDGVETRHTYNARNQLVRTEGPDGIREYTHDRRGNLVRVTENGRVVASYTFDATGRMTEAVTDKGKAEYTYNGFLKRVGMRHVSPDGTTGESLKYVLDLTKPYNDLLAIERTGKDPRPQRFIWGDELLMSEGTDPGHSFSYLNDHLGSPIRLVGDGHGQALAYDEFGVPTVEPDPDTGQSQSLHNPFGFTGYQTDKVTGLCYAQARWYGADVGRFVSEDAYKGNPSDPLSLNPYPYCKDNSMNQIDPGGNIPWLLFPVLLGVGAALSGCGKKPEALPEISPEPVLPSPMPSDLQLSTHPSPSPNSLPNPDIQLSDILSQLWDTTTINRINELHPSIRLRTASFVLDAQGQGINLRVTSGYRSIDEQNELYEQGRTMPGSIVTQARGGQSYHNFGLAFDVVEIRDGGSYMGYRLESHWEFGKRVWVCMGRRF